MIIGKGGGGIEDLKKKFQAPWVTKLILKINIEEVKEVNLQHR
jgi:ribosomal protein S3